MKGIVLAGGAGTRLYPITVPVSKQLLPIYDKPMVYYPVSVLMLAGIRDILLIAAPDQIDSFKRLFGDGSSLGLSFSYEVQPRPDGIAQAFLIGRDFIADDPCCLILGDNFFFGERMAYHLDVASARQDGATIFATRVEDPERYGVVAFDASGAPKQIVEKPTTFLSNWAVTGLYFYDRSVVEIAAALKPSSRGELEITDLNLEYLRRGRLHVELLGRGFAWLDTGTHDSLLEAAEFVRTVQHRQGLRIGCLEEIAYRKGFIGLEELAGHAQRLGKTGYGRYLASIVETPNVPG